MERREESPEGVGSSKNISMVSSEVGTRSMIDITFQKKNTDMFGTNIRTSNCSKMFQ